MQYVDECRIGIMSKDNKEWILKNCQSAACNVTVPKHSVYNKMGFVQQPPKLNVYPMEERLVALRIPFMQI